MTSHNETDSSHPMRALPLSPKRQKRFFNFFSSVLFLNGIVHLSYHLADDFQAFQRQSHSSRVYGFIRVCNIDTKLIALVVVAANMNSKQPDALAICQIHCKQFQLTFGLCLWQISSSKQNEAPHRKPLALDITRPLWTMKGCATRGSSSSSTESDGTPIIEWCFMYPFVLVVLVLRYMYIRACLVREKQEPLPTQYKIMIPNANCSLHWRIQTTGRLIYPLRNDVFVIKGFASDTNQIWATLVLAKLTTYLNRADFVCCCNVAL